VEVFEAMGSCRAMRYLRPDPVPEELIRKLVWGATRASNPGNSQCWEFLVLRDAERKRRIGAEVARRMTPFIEARRDDEDPVARRMYRGVAHLLAHFAEVPVWIVIGGRAIYPPERPVRSTVWSSVYPAGQNLVLAARALGLGATFTTFHISCEALLRESLGIPEDVLLGVMAAVGWPDRPFGPVARKPLEEVVHWDRW